MGRLIAIDASAVIAVVTNESHKPVLVSLTTGAELISPISLPIEVGNAFSAMFKRERLSLAAARGALHAFHEIAIRLTPVDLEHAIELSHELQIYAYDAYLVACSLRHRAPLLSLDSGLRAAARQAGAEVLEVPR